MRRKKGEKVIHVNTMTPNNLYILLLFLLVKKRKDILILSIHGCANFWDINKSTKSSICKKIYFKLISYFSYLIIDNYDQEVIIKKYLTNIRYSYVVEFIPPVIKQLDNEKVPKYIWDFYNKFNIILYSMASIAFYNNTDLYGIDMLIKMMKTLKDENNNVGLVIKLLSGIEKNRNYYNKIRKFVAESNLKNNILFIEGRLEEVYPLEKEASIMVRPSCTDGDSLSVRESLYFGVPVVVSDAVQRPEGCILFKTRDQLDFEEKVKNTINRVKKEEFFKKFHWDNNAEKIINIYKKLLSEEG